MLKKHSFWTFSIRNWDYREISNIQFCRASQALSIGIWLNLKREKVLPEKFLKTKKSIFDDFLSDFWGCLRSAASSEPKEVRQAVIFWIHIWYIRPEIPRGSNPKSVDPHVFRYSKIFEFFMERLLSAKCQDYDKMKGSGNFSPSQKRKQQFLTCTSQKKFNFT